MKTLGGKMVEVKALSQSDKNRMFYLMDKFYENMSLQVFLSDLHDKDYCIVLFDEDNTIQGFSTQKIIEVNLAEKVVYGVFSGDTIVHKDFWGTPHPLFRVFGQFFEKYSRDYDEFYWFLICKGYKTYKILPTFFNEFYPCYKYETPRDKQELINAFGISYSQDFNKSTGVIEYKGVKDKLRSGVADIDENKLKNKHTAFFVKKNPNYNSGFDMVCITSLKKPNYQKSKEAHLWG